MATNLWGGGSSGLQERLVEGTSLAAMGVAEGSGAQATVEGAVCYEPHRHIQDRRHSAC